MPSTLPSIASPTSRVTAGRWQRMACHALLVVSALTGCRQQPADDVSQIPHTPIPKTEARLQLVNDRGTARYQGVVADEATRDAIVRSARATFGNATSGEIVLDPHTNPPPWAGNLGALFAAFRLPGAVLALEGRQIELGGTVSDEDRANLLRKTRVLYPGYELAGLFQGVDMKHALPESGDTAGLVAFLNAIPIAFQDDSGMIAPTSLGGFDRAARALKAADRATRLQAGVYAGQSETPDYDLQIAAQRADAVRMQLALRGINPQMIQPVVLPAGGNKGRTVEFSAPRVPATAADAAQALAEPTASNPGGEPDR